MNIHPYVIRNYNGVDIEIDVEIVSLIDTLWKLGLETLWCCQGDGEDINYPSGYVTLTTKSFFDLLEVLSIKDLMLNTAELDYNRASEYGKKGVAIRFHKRQLTDLTNCVKRAYNAKNRTSETGASL